MGALPGAKLSVEEYLARDRDAQVLSEYHDGEIFPLVAVSLAHGTIQNNVGWRLGERLIGSPCRVSNAGVRVRASATKFIVPDTVVVCGKPALTDEHQDTLTNPKVIVEILSPSTEDYDY